MGREIKRVPLDFDWPLNKVWKGYVNPHFKPCPEDNKTCFNGNTAGGAWLAAIVRLLMVAGADGADGGKRRVGGRIWPHPYLAEFVLAPTFDPPEGWWSHPTATTSVIPPTSDLAQLTEGLAGRAMAFSMHDACDNWAAYNAIKKAAGVPKKWGVCPVCKGHCIDPSVRKVYNKWKPTKLPKGKGWQVWETVSAGSPISPVFASSAQCVDWLVGQGHTREAANSFVNDTGWVPSGVSVGGKLYENVESAGLLRAKP